MKKHLLVIIIIIIIILKYFFFIIVIISTIYIERVNREPHRLIRRSLRKYQCKPPQVPDSMIRVQIQVNQRMMLWVGRFQMYHRQQLCPVMLYLLMIHPEWKVLTCFVIVYKMNKPTDLYSFITFYIIISIIYSSFIHDLCVNKQVLA